MIVISYFYNYFPVIAGYVNNIYITYVILYSYVWCLELFFVVLSYTFHSNK